MIVVGGGTILVDGPSRAGARSSPTTSRSPTRSAPPSPRSRARWTGSTRSREIGRDEALADAKASATEAAVAAGAPASIEIVDVEDVPLAYLPGNATRVRVKAVGGLLHV